MPKKGNSKDTYDKNNKVVVSEVQIMKSEEGAEIKDRLSSDIMKNINSNSLTNPDVLTEISNKRQEVTIMNENDVYEEISFTSDEILESLQLEDSTVEIVGFIDEIDGPKIVGKTQHYQLLKFIVNNNSRHRVQILTWNAEIDRIKHHIQPNRIIHIDGAKAKKPKVSEFNQGTLPYELIIRSNTIINNIGSFDLKKVIDAVQPRLVNLPEISGYLNSCVLIQGFIKTRLNSFTKSFKTVGSGSITDGVYKLEIQIMEYEHENLYNKGDYVEVKGYVKILNDIFYLELQTMSDIKFIGDKTLSFAKLLLGSKPILKRTLSESGSGSPNKMFRN